MIAFLRGATRLVALAATAAVLAPLQLLVLAVTRGPAALVLPRVFHRAVRATLGIRMELAGAPVAAGQVVFLCNHLSHLDIPVIGSRLRVRFVAKDDVRGWPLLGALARLQQTVFVSRNPRQAATVATMLADALASGHNLVVFPEGTTSDGRDVLPFKSSLFAALSDPALAHVVLQPMTLELVAVDGRRIDAGGERDLYAYHGSMRLLPHLLAFVRLAGAHVRLRLHPPLPAGMGLSRKDLATLAQARVAAGLARPAREPA